MKKILFVCTGNTCRSAMAEGFLKSALAADNELSAQYCTASAGVAAFDGDPASPNAIQVMHNDWKIDIKNHLSSSIREDAVEDAFLILVMTTNHKEAILSMFPEAYKKVFTLKEYAFNNAEDTDLTRYNQPLDIIDPYGMPPDIYSRCALEIKLAVEKLVEKFKNI